MKTHIISCLPEEACGLLAGKGCEIFQTIPITNVLRSPHHFRMDPEEQWAAMVNIEKEGYQMLGIFHSHVYATVELSETDLKEITYPEVAYLIWAKLDGDWYCRAYRI